VISLIFLFTVNDSNIEPQSFGIRCSSFHSAWMTRYNNCISVIRNLNVAHTKHGGSYSILSPQLIKNYVRQLKHKIEQNEKVQWQFTKRLNGLNKSAYNEWLKVLGLRRLELHCLQFDLMYCYKDLALSL